MMIMRGGGERGGVNKEKRKRWRKEEGRKMGKRKEKEKRGGK